MSSAGLTHPGLVRKKNEDHFVQFKDRKLFLVADGMGGHQGGEVASHTAIQIIADDLTDTVLTSAGSDQAEIRHALLRSFERANNAVMVRANSDETLTGMGCTLIAAVLNGQTLHTCHVGDTRCYVVDDLALHQITQDHSALVERLNDSSPNLENDPLPARHAVTRVIGFPFPEPPEYNAVHIKSGDRILLCSDGLWSMVDEESIRTVLQEARSAEKTVETLIDLANEAGGLDNITAVLIMID